MALSNWDTLAVDEKGESTNGVFVSPRLGVSVELYKNWIYVRDEKAWEEGGGYISPTVMEVQHGNFQYKDVKIVARRGPQNGIYAVVQSTIYPPQLEFPCGKCSAKKGGYFHDKACADFVDTSHTVMIGCGVYGYDDSEWVGVTEDSKNFLQAWVQGYQKDSLEIPRAIFKPELSNEMIIAIAAAKGETLFEKDGKIMKEYDSYEFDEDIRKIDLSKALRFNQGDQFLANRVGLETPATAPGETDRPIFMQALDAGKDAP